MGSATWHYSLVYFRVSSLLAQEESNGQQVLCSHPKLLSATFTHKLSLLVQKYVLYLSLAVFASRLLHHLSTLGALPSPELHTCPPATAESVCLRGASSEEAQWLSCEFAKLQTYPLSLQLLELQQCKALPVTAIWTPACVEVVSIDFRKGCTPKTTIVMDCGTE